MEMRVSPDGVNYWGNTFIRDPNLLAKTGQWMCVEVMVKMNNPLSERNGEMALWIDGTQIIDLRQGSPLGNWVSNMFTPSPTGVPFEGFRWRTVDLLKLNWIWLQHYVTDDPAGFVGRVWWVHIVRDLPSPRNRHRRLYDLRWPLDGGVRRRSPLWRSGGQLHLLGAFADDRTDAGQRVVVESERLHDKGVQRGRRPTGRGRDHEE